VPGYEVLGVLGRGGMGVVYRARQVGLDRLVALKMILAGEHAGPEERARFRTEAEAVARLQDPHIVQIFEVGEHEGRPYLALEYADGGSLAPQVAGTPQPPRPAAQLVQTLARALHHAHQRGILHRDLKPANILLQRATTNPTHPTNEQPGGRQRDPGTGTHTPAPPDASDPCASWFTCLPKVTDFGLAKRLDRAGDQTQSGALLGTPSYMAPEQAAGQTRAIGPATDVYGLGATLYELLTGRPPHKGTGVAETLEQVRSQEPVAPRRLQPKVPRDLETVCLKCLHKEPGQRYASALALADDLGRFLAGEPIRARPVGVWGRGLKWARRRPAAAALVAVSVLAGALLVATLALSNLWIAREKQRADENYRLAETRRREAEANLQTAEANLETALDAVERMLTRVGVQHLARAPQTEHVRRKLLEDALSLQLKLLDDNGRDPAVRLRTGRGYRVVADIDEMRGDYDRSQAHYDRAREILEKLVDEAPAVAAYQHQLALVYRNQGKLLYLHRSRHPDAKEAYGRALELLQKLVAEHPGVAQYQADLVRSQSGWCAVVRVLGGYEAAEEVSRQTETLLIRLAADFPGVEDYRYMLAGVYNNRAAGLNRQGRFPEAEGPIRQAVRLYEKPLADSPGVPSYRRDQANSLMILGATLLRIGNPAAAEPFVRQSVKLLGKLAADYPTVVDYQRLLCWGHHQLGQVLRETGRLREAEAAYGLAVEAWRKLVKQYPRAPLHRLNLANSLLRQGGALRDRGRLDDAVKAVSGAGDLYRQHVKEFPEEPEYRQQLAAAYHTLGMVLHRRQDYAEAERAFREALPILERLAAENPAVPTYRRDLANTRAYLGRTLLAHGPSQPAAGLFEQAVASWRELVAGSPDSTDYRNGLASALAAWGDHRAAAREAAELVRVTRDRALGAYPAAGIVAVCATAVLRDGTLPEAERRRLAQAYAGQALDLLRDAVRHGFRGFELLEKDPDFGALRSREEFQKLLAELGESRRPGAK
jgi:serine/threonine protein kinase